MSNTQIVDPLTNHSISPATKDLQEAILAQLACVSQDLFETYKISIGAAGIAQGPNVGCKDLILSTDATDLQITIVDDPADLDSGDANGFLVPTPVTGGVLPLNVQNAARLRFYATAGKIVYLLLRV